MEPWERAAVAQKQRKLPNKKWLHHKKWPPKDSFLLVCNCYNCGILDWLWICLHSDTRMGKSKLTVIQLWESYLCVFKKLFFFVESSLLYVHIHAVTCLKNHKTSWNQFWQFLIAIGANPATNAVQTWTRSGCWCNNHLEKYMSSSMGRIIMDYPIYEMENQKMFETTNHWHGIYSQIIPYLHELFETTN